MALPIVKNINYYRGDTYTERIYPKASDGSAFPLVDTNDDDYLSYFYIDVDRDTTTEDTLLEGITDLNSGDSYIGYAITPAVGIQLDADATYVYEVKIKNQATGEVYTLVTGNIVVSENVKNLT